MTNDELLIDSLGKSSSSPFFACKDEESKLPNAPKEIPSSRLTPVTVNPLIVMDFNLLFINNSLREYSAFSEEIDSVPPLSVSPVSSIAPMVSSLTLNDRSFNPFAAKISGSFFSAKTGR